LLIKHVFFSLLILITLLHNPYESSGHFVCATRYIYLHTDAGDNITSHRRRWGR